MPMLEHPDITSARRTGYPADYKETHQYCPVCGSKDPWYFYFSYKEQEVVGCSECVKERSDIEAYN